MVKQACENTISALFLQTPACPCRFLIGHSLVPLHSPKCTAVRANNLNHVFHLSCLTAVCRIGSIEKIIIARLCSRLYST